MPRRVWLALFLALGLHGMLILTARYRFSFDAYTHMFFADHYRTDWWSLWDPRWYGGFSVTTYPPLVHQVIGLTGRLTGVDTGFAVVLWAVLAAYPLAVYRFSRVFVDSPSAEYAALGAAVLPSIFLAGYTFGQLPTLTGSLLALFCAAVLAEFLQTGQRLSGFLAVMLAATTMSAHHATLLFFPWLLSAVVLHLLLARRIPLKTLLRRLAIFGLFASAAGILVIWPFWDWGMKEVMQTPIDHLSRHNFFTDSNAAFLFFWSQYGPLAALIPFAVWKIRSRRWMALTLSFGALFLLGLGGTTPLPRWLFGVRWEWLTYDRFALWASLLLLPFLGSLLTRWEPAQSQPPGGAPSLPFIQHLPAVQERVLWVISHAVRYWRLTAVLSILAATAFVVSLYPRLLPTQPEALDMQPIVEFLAQDDAARWRYLTFGFGDQFAYLSRLTSATTIDGSYHTARMLPELRSSGIAAIDSVYWLPAGLAALDPILQIAGKYGVRWGLVGDPKYIPVLQRNGWTPRTMLSNGVQVWENPNLLLPPDSAQPAPEPLESFSWGTLPLLALAMTTALAALRLRPVPARNTLLWVHTIAIGLLPVGLVFWYYRPLTDIEYSRVYFAYSSALFFLSDGLALTAVLAWTLARWFAPQQPVRPEETGSFLRRFLQSISPWFLAICLLASLSILWSRDWRVSLYLSLHLWLGFWLFASLRNSPPSAWKAAIIGLCAALAIQAASGVGEFITQSTAFLAPLRMPWPGVLSPEMRGVSVVQLADGARWLRVYGTLPHPNILGTFAVVFLAGPASLFLTLRKPRVWALLLFCAGIVLLVISFSRGAWLGLFASMIVLLLKFRGEMRKRLAALIIAGGLCILAIVVPYRALFFTRLGGGASIPTEEFSVIGRAWLMEQAVSVIRQHPLAGLGLGSFVLDLAQRAAVGYIIEPVHSLPLLVVSELGISSAVILTGMGIVLIRTIWRARDPRTTLISAALVGLLVTSLFDHSLWTQAPGRILLCLMLGLWAGESEPRR